MSTTSGYENGPTGPGTATPGDWLPPAPQVESIEGVLVAMQAALRDIVSANRFPTATDLTVAVPSHSHPSRQCNPSDGDGRYSIEPAAALDNVSALLNVQDGFCRYQTDPRYKHPYDIRSIADEISARVHSPTNTPVVQKEANRIYKSPERRLVVATSIARLGVAVMHKHGAVDSRNMLEHEHLTGQDFPDAPETPQRLWQAFTADLEAMGVITLPGQGGKPVPVKASIFSRLTTRRPPGR